MAKTRILTIVMANTRNIYSFFALKLKKFKTYDNGGVAPWSDLNHDVLCMVMMQLGVVDFFAFSGVCKSWRALAVSNMNMFMASRLPMSISISNLVCKKQFHFKDFEGRMFKTLIPHSCGRYCVGLTCGYLVLYGQKTCDFWLVNPITRHERHFLDVPFEVCLHPEYFRAILVFSPLISGWVFVVIDPLGNKIWYSVGRGAWNHVSCTFPVMDLHVFEGKIYTLHYGYHVCEMRLDPRPKLTLLDTKNFPKHGINLLDFVSSSENLYVIQYKPSQDLYKLYELDFGEMKWVCREKTIHEYAFFVSHLNRIAAVMPESWDVADKSRKGKFIYANMWYFPHDCLNVNLMDE